MTVHYWGNARFCANEAPPRRSQITPIYSTCAAGQMRTTDALVNTQPLEEACCPLLAGDVEGAEAAATENLQLGIDTGQYALLRVGAFPHGRGRREATSGHSDTRSRSTDRKPGLAHGR